MSRRSEQRELVEQLGQTKPRSAAPPEAAPPFSRVDESLVDDEPVRKSISESGVPDNSSLSPFSARTRPSWLNRSVRDHRAGVDALRQYDLCTDLDERCYFRFDVRGVARSLGLLDCLAGGLTLLDKGVHGVLMLLQERSRLLPPVGACEREINPN